MSEKTPPKPDNFLPWAILSTVLCCIPFGIVAIVHASKVDGFWLSGHYEEAEKAAKNAKTWTFVAAATSLAVIILYMFALIVASA